MKRVLLFCALALLLSFGTAGAADTVKIGLMGSHDRFMGE